MSNVITLPGLPDTKVRYTKGDIVRALRLGLTDAGIAEDVESVLACMLFEPEDAEDNQDAARGLVISLLEALEPKE